MKSAMLRFFSIRCHMVSILRQKKTTMLTEYREYVHILGQDTSASGQRAKEESYGVYHSFNRGYIITAVAVT